MLSTDQIAAYTRDGYLVVPDVVPQDVLDRVRAEYAGLLGDLYAKWDLPEAHSFEDKLITAYRAGRDWFQPMDISLPGDRIAADTPMHFGPAVFEMATHARLLDMVEDLIGPEITSNPIQHVRIKPPATELNADEVRAHITSTDWHQDRAVALEEADQTDMVTVWLAVTDATIENGCLKVQPFNGPQDILPHCPKKQTAIADQFIDEEGAVPLPVPSGCAVLFHPLVPHASLPNTSQGIRWSFDLRFNKSGQPTGRGHFPDFIARSRANPETELHDWKAWRSMWEDARARLAAEPHIDIHRWTSDAPYCA
ncbi:Ectoine hydroxylase-related dioxygenase, phytanoyl-CoA dioxygenase (PhyH) family [Litoreibacter ascidiaceicola]|uniref:Ectoine hydroxylase-related dioxygenase, phytanoyl-CoA dioxygenase (PhyH) family n=1 Tax=Litoreibacter ascidiaceicola TaxID=1486859 RepID=A0A1M4ZRW3_9RHOB|nr:phytanoyl-CoA dioxygenase family protein [Litoreibacter ascidiaceicola]SHF20522.1 Ectoine hydroxylase-related dioxygenase, phytanoyl-CoA dioxygenase (PhyH) family [Litoreibacter ascidiaceicola]